MLHTLIHCVSLVNLFASLIYGAPVSEPEMGRGKRFFSFLTVFITGNCNPTITLCISCVFYCILAYPILSSVLTNQGVQKGMGKRLSAMCIGKLLTICLDVFR